MRYDIKARLIKIASSTKAWITKMIEVWIPVWVAMTTEPLIKPPKKIETKITISGLSSDTMATMMPV